MSQFDLLSYLVTNQYAQQMSVSAAQRQVNNKIDYSKLDPEVIELVRSLNGICGLFTVMSCFGHPEDESDRKNHQLFAFIDIGCTDPEVLMTFWSFVLSYTHGRQGKVFLESTRLAGFHAALTLQLNPARKSVGLRLEIAPFSLRQSRFEKLVGLRFVSNLARAFIDSQKPAPLELGFSEDFFEPTLSQSSLLELKRSFVAAGLITS